MYSGWRPFWPPGVPLEWFYPLRVGHNPGLLFERPLSAEVRIGDGNADEAFEVRWLAEALEAGDIIVPASGAIPAPGTVPPVLDLMAFEAATPPDIVAARLAEAFGPAFRNPGLSPEAMATLIAAYR